MPEFQQTVDLRKVQQKKTAAPKNVAAPLDKIYQSDNNSDSNLKKIDQPKEKKFPQGLIKIIVFILAFLIIGATIYFLFYRSNNFTTNNKKASWYAISLKDSGMTYYGQIFDIKANPVIINNVYYDYDQNEAIKNNKPFNRTGDLRLVKQGKETYGPESTISIYQSNISTLTPLKSDSKVLKAILEYER